MTRRVRAEILAQCLAERFEGQEHWEWNEVADWLVEVFLPTEDHLCRLKKVLQLEGATYVTYDEALDQPVARILDGLGLEVQQREIGKGRSEPILVLETGEVEV